MDPLLTWTLRAVELEDVIRRAGRRNGPPFPIVKSAVKELRALWASLSDKDVERLAFLFYLQDPTAWLARTAPEHRRDHLSSKSLCPYQIFAERVLTTGFGLGAQA